MANWCFTTYVITGDPKELSDLVLKLEYIKYIQDSVIDSSFDIYDRLECGGTALVNIAESWGISDMRASRGELTNLEYLSGDSDLQMTIESAWTDFPELWDSICEHYNSLKNYYFSEEPGEAYYTTNDIEGLYFTERYKIDWGYECEYFSSISEVLEYLSEHLKPVTQETFRSVIDEHNKECKYDYHIYFNEVSIK